MDFLDGSAEQRAPAGLSTHLNQTVNRASTSGPMCFAELADLDRDGELRRHLPDAIPEPNASWAVWWDGLTEGLQMHYLMVMDQARFGFRLRHPDIGGEPLALFRHATPCPRESRRYYPEGPLNPFPLDEIAALREMDERLAEKLGRPLRKDESGSGLGAEPHAREAFVAQMNELDESTGPFPFTEWEEV